MILENGIHPWENKNSHTWKVGQALWETKNEVDTILNSSYEIIAQELKILEKTQKWFSFKENTLQAFFKKYPDISVWDFKLFFLNGTYNKNIFMCSEEIIELLDINEINAWDDIIEYVIKKLSLSHKDFEEKVVWKIDTLTFPNLAAGDVAQWYFFEKLKTLLPGTQIIFWDMVEIKSHFWKNQFNCNSVDFIDLMWNGLFNTCLLKLLKTPPVQEKIDELNTLFSQIEKDIFIWGSSFNIPFNIPESLYWISMPKMPLQPWKKPTLTKTGMLMHSMWYLNSAYYTDKIKGSFVSWSHNIAEPMHAGKLTVINNDPTNRYNHNWLISYFWEKCDLLLYIDGAQTEIQDNVNNFLEISQDELKERYKKFQEVYASQIQPLVYGIFYLFMKKNFPSFIK